MTADNRIHFRIQTDIKEDLKIAARLKGLKPSAYIHSLVVEAIGEAKKRNPEAFADKSKGPGGEHPHLRVHAPKKCQNCGSETNKPICPACHYPMADAEYLSEVDIDKLPYGVIRLASDGTILEFNKAEKEMAQIQDKRMVGVNFFKFAPCEGVKRLRDQFRKFLEGGGKPEQFDTTYSFKFGAVRVTLTFFKESEGIGYVVSTRNKKQSEHGVA